MPLATGAATRAESNRTIERQLPSGADPLADPVALGVLSRIREAAEQAKITLSTEPETEIALPFLTPEFSFSCASRAKNWKALDAATSSRAREPHCLRSLADAKLEPKELDQVILVGGQTRMPLVRRLVGEWFGCAEFEETRGGIRLGTEYHRPQGPQLNTSQNPDEAVALGAAIQAEILVRRLSATCCCSMSRRSRLASKPSAA